MSVRGTHYICWVSCPLTNIADRRYFVVGVEDFLLVQAPGLDDVLVGAL